MVLKVLEIVQGCNTAAQGRELFEAIWPQLELEESVALSFEGVTEVTSSFINASIVRLVLQRDYESVGARLAISDISKQAAEMIRRCLRNAREHKAA